MDSGAAIARRVATILGLAAPAELPLRPVHRAIFTADTPAVARMRSGLAGFGLGEVAFLEPTPHAEIDDRQDRAQQR